VIQLEMRTNRAQTTASFEMHRSHHEQGKWLTLKLHTLNTGWSCSYSPQIIWSYTSCRREILLEGSSGSPL
jgi:hypothetical protein